MWVRPGSTEVKLGLEPSLCAEGVSSKAISNMPRLPLHTFLQRAKTLTLTRPPSQSTPAYPPRISAICTGRSFTYSLPRQRFTATPRRLDKYTPDRIPDAAWPYLYKRLDTMAHLDPYFKQVDTLQDQFIERLREAVAIPSISSEDARRPDVVKVCCGQTPVFELSLTMISDGPLARGPNQSAWWYRRAS
jgi:hypothetical protein